jgi:hypothetical protein
MRLMMLVMAVKILFIGSHNSCSLFLLGGTTGISCPSYVGPIGQFLAYKTLYILTELEEGKMLFTCNMTLCHSLADHCVIDHHSENFQTCIDINILVM